MQASTVSSGFEDQVGTCVVRRAQVESPACPRSPIPKNIKATPETWISSTGSERSLFVSKVLLRAGFQPRKIMEVVAYDNIMEKRKPRFAYHLFDLNLAELERSRRFELKVSRLSYWRDHRNVQLWI